MTLRLYASEDVGANVLAGLVLVADVARAGRASADFYAGIGAMARYVAVAHHVSWAELLAGARAVLGDDLADLLDGTVLVDVRQTIQTRQDRDVAPVSVSGRG